ncbi:MAG: DUF2165 family protein [Woeseiaceae bacterium]|nr:DUF2165 family protein [Woeseiaceae bacterium]
MKAVRYVKIFLVLTVGFWGLIGTFGNLAGMSDVYNEVLKVTSMASVPEGAGPPWRTSSPIVVWLGYTFILLGKVVALVGGAWGGVLLLKHVNAPAADFNRAKSVAIAGCGAAFALMFFTFTVFGESVFFMFFDPLHSGAAALAFRLAGSFALVALFVALPDSD